MKSQIDPLLRHLLNDAHDDPPISDDSQPRDPVADMFHEIQFGIPADGAPVAKKLTVPQIASALDSLRKSLRSAPCASRQELLERLSAASEEFCDEGSFVREFLHAAAKGDDQGMKLAVKALVADNRDSILDLNKHLSVPTSEKGEPSTKVKRGNWTFCYDAGGDLEKVFEGDAEPFFN